MAARDRRTSGAGALGRTRPVMRAASGASVLAFILGLVWWLPRSASQPVPGQYARVVAGEVVERTLLADDTVTFEYDGRSEIHSVDAAGRYMLVELTYDVEGDQYPDPLLMVAYEAVPFIFYADNQFTTNATYYDQVAFQLVKTYHHVVVDRQGIQPGSWYITITNLPVWSRNSLDFRLTVTTSGAHPCPNQCSNHGTCTADGTCACAPGWGDSDCSQTMRPITLDTTLSTHLRVDEWQYFYVDPLAGGQTVEDGSYILADMTITSDPRCDALLYFKHEDSGFTELPTHYDFQYHSDKISFYRYDTTYQKKYQPIVPGQYILGIFNYEGRRIEEDCDISLTVTACYSADDSCESGQSSHMAFQTTTGWFLALFVLAALPLFCFIPFFYCIRRIRAAHRRRNGWADGTARADGQMQGQRRPRAVPGLTNEEIASVTSFVYEPDNAEQCLRYPNLSSDSCSVCLMPFEADQILRELACRHAFHSECIDQWLRRQRSCPLCKADALQGNPSSSGAVGGSGDTTDNDGIIGDMPGTPTRSSSSGAPVTLDAADMGDVEEARPPSSHTQAAPVASLSRIIGGARARTPPPLPNASATHDGTTDQAVGP